MAYIPTEGNIQGHLLYDDVLGRDIGKLLEPLAERCLQYTVSLVPSFGDYKPKHDYMTYTVKIELHGAIAPYSEHERTA